MRPTVAVCIPSGELVHTRMVINLVDLLFSAHQSVNVPMNKLVRTAQEYKADYVLFIDSDMMFPKDALARLIDHDRDIVGATYCKRAPPFEIIGKTVAGDMPCSGLVEAEWLPAGMLLIRASVFERMAFPWFYESYVDGDLHSEDANFCDDARKTGLSVWLDCDLSFELAHLAVYPVTIPQVIMSRANNG